jgi:hypothetical protein
MKATNTGTKITALDRRAWWGMLLTLGETFDNADSSPLKEEFPTDFAWVVVVTAGGKRPPELLEFEEDGY